MDKKQVIDIVSTYKAAVLKLLPDARVFLFGSYSKGNARQDSDIDVAVVVPKFEGDWLAISSSLWGVTWNISTLIEPVLIEECHPSPLYEDILKTGIAV